MTAVWKINLRPDSKGSVDWSTYTRIAEEDRKLFNIWEEYKVNVMTKRDDNIEIMKLPI